MQMLKMSQGVLQNEAPLIIYIHKYLQIIERPQMSGLKEKFSKILVAIVCQ
jgi:hypothetical protein